jgi:hypothetical protein
LLGRIRFCLKAIQLKGCKIPFFGKCQHEKI